MQVAKTVSPKTVGCDAVGSLATLPALSFFLAPLLSLVCTGSAAATPPQLAPAKIAPPQIVPLRIEARSAVRGREKYDWWQARTAHVPGETPFWLTTMSETGKTGTHDFHDIYQTISRDGGRRWSKPQVIPTLKRSREADGYEVVAGDLWPTWHARSQRVLATGKTFNFEAGRKENRLRERVSYAVFNPQKARWSELRFLKLPMNDQAGFPIIACNAGCTQRVDLPNGDVLLPIRYWRDPKRHNYTSTVARCEFDGETLTYREHGTELTIPAGRGLYEPSLIRHLDRYYLTLRADKSGYVSSSRDGLGFQPIREWRFDDGEPLGSYNTQQHWLSLGGGLFLIYTRRDAENDHIFRHRAPLFIAQVHPETLTVLRSTERVLIPENGATLGNSGVCMKGNQVAWLTCGEGLLRLGKRKGEKNRIHFIEISPADPIDQRN